MYKKLFLRWINLIVIFLNNNSLNAHNVWVANYDDDSISIINENKILNVNCGKGPREILIVPTYGIALIAECDQHSISVINSDTYEFQERIQLDDEPRGIVFDNVSKIVLGLLKNKNKLFSFSFETKKFVFCDIPEGPRQLLVDDLTKTIWITCNTANVISICSLESLKLIKKIYTYSQPYAIIKLNEFTNIVSSIGDNKIIAYNRINYDYQWSIECGLHPTCLLRNQDNLYVTNFDDNIIKIFDTSNMHFKKSISTGLGPFNIIFKNNYLFISNNGDNTVIKMEPQSLENVETFKVGLSPHGLA